MSERRFTVTSSEPGSEDKGGKQDGLLRFVKFLKKIILTNPLIVIIDLINIAVFIYSVVKDYFYFSLIVVLFTLGLAFILFLARNLIYSYINNNQKIKDILNPREVRKWIEDFSHVQIMFFILLLCSYLIIVRQYKTERYYQDMDSALGFVIETKVATSFPTTTVTPTVKITLRPTITQSPTITPTSTSTPELEENHVIDFIDGMFSEVERYILDENLEYEVDLPKYFCDEQGKKGKEYISFSENYIARILNNYKKNGNSIYKFTCDSEIDLTKIYDHDIDWHVEMTNKCTVICTLAKYYPEYQIELDLLKPSTEDEKLCIYKFKLVR